MEENTIAQRLAKIEQQLAVLAKAAERLNNDVAQLVRIVGIEVLKVDK